MSENPEEQTTVEDENVQSVPAAPVVVEADESPVEGTTDDVPADEEPVQPEEGNYDVRFQSATEEDATYDVEETNPKEDVTDE